MSHTFDMTPAPAELTILKQLWAEAPLSAREIHDRITDELGWSYSSTRKTIDRMEAKKMLRVRTVHGLKVFTARVGKVATIAGMTRDFAARVLGIDGPLPVASFTDSKLLTPEELEELQELLKTEEPK